jgi:hypothetical protein
VKSKSNFSITLQLGNKTYKSSGATPTEALGALPKPNKIMAKGVVTVTAGKVKKELLLPPVKVKPLFYNSSGVQEVKAKQLFSLMK